MPASPAEIETIVQAVLQRLRSLSAAPSAEQAGAGAPRSAAPPAEKKLVLAARVVSLDLLPSDLQSIDCVQVSPSAVVTPAVRDELRWQNVRLERQVPVANGQASPTETGLLVVAPSGHRLAELACEQTSSSGNPTADVCRLAAHVNSAGELALWWTPTPYAACCAAGGNSSLRPVHLADPQDWQRALDEAEPNVLIVDSRRWDNRALADLANAVIPALANRRHR